MPTAGDDKVVSAFLEAARSYRSAVAGDAEYREFARRLRNAVATLYLAAASLPRAGSEATQDPATLDRTTSQALEERIRARFRDTDTSVDVSSLAQELVEIDEDLARSIAWLEEPRAADALWDVWFAFEGHWGKHAVDVLRPLHHIAGGRVG